MDTFQDLITAVQSDLNITTDSTLFPLVTVKLALNRAYRKAGGLFRWAETEDAQKTSTQALQQYYDYPSNWRPGSAWKLVIDSEDYGDPLTFKDFMYEIENDVPLGADYLWANQWRRFFVYPTPTTSGSNNISIYGIKVVDSLTNLTDTTIFSYSQPECNDAVVIEAVAILKAKGEDEKSSLFKSAEAKQILATAWSKYAKETAKYEKSTPYFSVPDFFGKNKSSDTIGKFDIIV